MACGEKSFARRCRRFLLRIGEGFSFAGNLTGSEGLAGARKGLAMRPGTIARFLISISLLFVMSTGSAAPANGLDLSAYRGKVVVVDFWASWCVPCRRSFPWMNAMHAKYGDEGLVIIAVNMDSDRSEANKFLEDYPANFAVVYDPEGHMARDYDVIAMPSSYVFGRDGRRITRHLGFKVAKQDEYESILEEALSR